MRARVHSGDRGVVGFLEVRGHHNKWKRTMKTNRFWTEEGRERPINVSYSDVQNRDIWVA